MFCKYCGNELPGTAVICVKCGCLVNDSAETTGARQGCVPQTPIMQTAQAPQAKPSRKFFRLAKIFSIIGLSVSIFALFCGFLFLYMMWSAFTFGDDGGGLFVALLSVFPLLAMAGISPFAFVSGLLSFIFKHKATEPTGALPTVAFILGMVALVFGWGMYFGLVSYGA